MSTFGGLLPEIEGISVDRFDGANVRSGAFFLSHCHSDHTVGLSELPSSIEPAGREFFVYASKLTCAIVERRWPRLRPHLRALRVDEPCLVRVPSSPDEHRYVTVTAVPAAHCPGSVMFAFERADGRRVLYTGDFRAPARALRSLRGLRSAFDAAYFDSTFWSERYAHFPDRERGVDVVCELAREWIAKGRNYHVSLSVPARYGYESLYMDVFRRLATPIHVARDAYELYSCIADMDGSITLDSNQTQIHSCDFNGNEQRLPCQRSNARSKVRTIRISAMSWRDLDGDEPPIYKKDGDREKYFVCYSNHCSYDELRSFIRYIKPARLVPCVVPQKSPDSLAKWYRSLEDFHASVMSDSTDNSNSEMKADLPALPATDDVIGVKAINIRTKCFKKENGAKREGSFLANLLETDDSSKSFQLKKKINLFLE